MESPIPENRRRVARSEVIAHYGSERSASLRTLYTWVNVTILLTFGWPAMVVFLDAPAVQPENTPTNWFLARLVVPVVVVLLVGLIWRSSSVPGTVAMPRAALRVFGHGVLWPQVMLFLNGVVGVLSIIMLVTNPGPAVKVLSLGFFEALAYQVIIPGYVKSTAETLDSDPAQLYRLSLGLFAVMFALQTALAAGIQTNATGNDIIAAGGAGILIGLLFGWFFLSFRDRSGSLLPGLLTQWLLIAIIPAFIGT